MSAFPGNLDITSFPNFINEVCRKILISAFYGIDKSFGRIDPVHGPIYKARPRTKTIN